MSSQRENVEGVSQPPSDDVIRELSRSLRQALGVSLFGIDVIINNQTGQHAVIDINAFPGRCSLSLYVFLVPSSKKTVSPSVFDHNAGLEGLLLPFIPFYECGRVLDGNVSILTFITPSGTFELFFFLHSSLMIDNTLGVTALCIFNCFIELFCVNSLY